MSEPRASVELETPLGKILIEVDPAAAPISAANFMRYVDEGRYDGACFYRTMRREHGSPGREMELVQGGLAYDPERSLPPIAHESPAHTGLLHAEGAVSLARREPGSASSEFFICMASCPQLDPTDRPTPPADGLGYAVFGRVVAGMDVARRIQAQPTSDAADSELLRGQMLESPVVIMRASRL
jgi:peptidyl-prolyl cis-trans isomerase A (cyclophilin A)